MSRLGSYRTGSLTLDGTTTAQVLELRGNFPSVACQFPSSTGLEVKYYVSIDGGTTYEPVYSRDAANTATSADVADVIAAGDLAFFPSVGATHIRVSRTAGEGTVIISGVDAEFETANVVLGTGSSIIGQVGIDQTTPGTTNAVYPKNGFNIQLTPTVGTAAYVAGDSIGGVLTFANAAVLSGQPIIIDSVSIVDKSQQSIPCTFQWFSATPSGGTYTDGSALVYGSGDYAKFQAQTRFQASDWISYPATPTDGFASKNDLGTGVAIAATSLFALLIADASFSLTAGDIIINVAGRRL